ncbi:MAG: M64 family metallopeptidase [Nanoarchaeota archaeon]|nr:M64 family metallopeptidase [Nanoarchaeota archaeon]
MLKRVFVIIAVLFALAPFVVAQDECASQTIPDGYLCIKGSQGMTIYNPADFSSIFGSAPVAQEDGLLLVKYGSGRRALDFGYLSGTIVPEGEKRLKITGGKYAAPNSNLSNISSPLFYINLAELPAYTIEMGEGSLYRKFEYGIICNEGCSISAKNIINSDPALCKSLADVKGEAFISHRSKISAVRHSDDFDFEGNEAYVTKIKELYSIDISPELNLSITAKASKYALFGKLGISTGEELLLQNKPLLELPEQAKYESYYLVTMQDGSLSPELNTNFAVFAKNSPQDTGAVTIYFEGRPVISLKSGNLVFVTSKPAYDTCSHMAAGNIMKWDNAFFFPVKSCAFVDIAGGKLNIKPRAFTDKEDNTYPLVLDLTLASWANMLEISEFECYGQVPCKITLEKYGLDNKQIVFTSEDIILDPPEGNFFDFGISFGAYVIALDGKNYERIFCDINRRECRIYRESDLNEGGTIWYSESQSVRPSPRTERVSLCSVDSECNDWQKCIEGLCVAKSECLPVSGANSGGSGKLDIVVTIEDIDIAANLLPEFSSGLSGTELMQKYARLVAGVEEQQSFHGMLSVEPFKSNSRKINFWVLGTERIPILRGNLLNTREASRSPRTACANADYSIILTQQSVGSVNGAGTSEVFVSKVDMERKGLGFVVLHEFGHALGRLADEYTVSSGRFNQGSNCVAKDSAQTEWAALVGGSTARGILRENNNNPWLGCGAYCGSQCTNYVRPSYNSIMRDTEFRYMDVAQTEPLKYNKVSEEVLKAKLRQYS